VEDDVTEQDEKQGFEEVSAFKLTEADIEWLYQQQRECTVCWTNKDGWPVGMPHLFVWSGGSFWITMSGQRKRVQALRNRPKSCIVISSIATSKGSGEMVAIKTLATVHDDRERLRWFLPHFLARAEYPPEHREEQFKLFFTPRRIVIEFKPVDLLSFSSHKLGAAMIASGQSEEALGVDRHTRSSGGS
jgi:hypothetical protein